MSGPSSESLPSVCLTEDQYIRELQTDCGQAIWVAGLSDGSKAYQDDARGGSAWLRLAKYCEANRLSIISLHLKFRSNVVQVAPDNAEGYFFAKEAVGVMGTVGTHHFYKMGHLENGRVIVTRWHVPTLTAHGVCERGEERAGACLIRRRNG